MPLGNQSYALGRSQRFYSIRDTNNMSGVFTQPTQAAKLLKSSFKKKTDERPRMDARTTADVLEVIRGLIECDWEIEAYLLPSGTAGTVPDLDAILTSVFGGRAVVGGTSVTYTPDSRQVADATHGTGSFSMLREYNNVFSQQAFNCWADTFKLALKGGDEPKVTISGGCQDIKTTGNAVTTALAHSSDTTITVSASDARQFYAAANSDGAASVIDIGTSTGHTVSAVDYGTGVITFSPGLSGDQASGVAVIPHVPTETTHGSPVSFTLGSIAIDGVGAGTIPIVGADIEYSNQMKPFKDEAFVRTVPDYVKNFRKVTGTLTFKARSDQIGHITRSEQLPDTTRSVTLICGTTAGSILTVSMAHVIIFEAEGDVPETEEGTIKLPFMALGSGSGDNSISLALT